jgi:putative transposase
MILNRNFKYRIYPTKEQEKLLLRWESILRFLWNLCHEQRLMGLARPKDERVFINNYEQQKQMTELLVNYPWIADVQSNARQEILTDLEKAWCRCFKRLAKEPHWKRRGDPVHIYIPEGACPFVLNGDRRTGLLCFKWSKAYKKLGFIKIMLDRLIQGKVKGWDITRSQDEWYASARCEIEKEDRAPVNNKVIGIDRGVNLLIADSDSRTINNPHLLSELQQKITRAQRVVDRKEKGSANQKKARKKVVKLQRLVARRREVLLNTESLYYAKNYGTVVLEKLKIENMTASAKGTIEEPGKNIKQKSGLNKAILDAGWGKFGSFVKYKLEERNGTLKEVNPSFTSQTCPNCGHISKDNRKTQAMFKCVKCGYEGNADIVAAINIKERGERNEVVVKKPRQRIFQRGRKPKVEDTTVKPTVKQPVEDNLAASPMKTIGDQRPCETGTNVREDVRSM